MMHRKVQGGKVEHRPDKKNHVWLRLFLFALIIGSLTLLLYKTDAIQLFLSKKRLLHFLQSLGPWGFAGLTVLQALQVIVSPLPGDLTGLLGGFLYGPLWGTVLSTIGLTIGSYVAFSFSRIFGRPFAERFVPEPAIKRFDYLLEQKGVFLVFLLFLIPGIPKDYLCYILGLGHLSTLEFIAIGGVGRLFGTILLSFGGNFIRLEQYGRFFILLGVALLVVLVAVAYKERLERLFREWQENSRRKEAPEFVRIDAL
jgi:uncharacterized membrane protein YdjX (TVP38/TMEM64 family)